MTMNMLNLVRVWVNLMFYTEWWFFRAYVHIKYHVERELLVKNRVFCQAYVGCVSDSWCKCDKETDYLSTVSICM